MGKKTVALILAGGAGTRLDILAKHRAKPAVPFAGKYRIIDFALSNCVNSGIYTVGILTQYLPRSLSEHIGIGRPWDLDRSFGGVTLLPPYQRLDGDWYNGTANSVYQNLSYVMDHKSENTLILAGDHIYKMNYQKMIRQHEKTGADLTVAVKEVPMENTSQFGILEVDSENRIIEFQEKPKEAKSNLASMGIYIFKTELLKELLLKYCGPNGGEDFGKHIIPKMLKDNKVFAHKFKGYWRDVGTIEEYWKANIELVSDYSPVDLYEEDFKIHTKSEELPPVKFGEEGTAVRSLISNGCRINGKIENSVISPGVVVEKGAIVRNSIIFNGTIINRDSIIDRTIIDKNVVIGKNCRIGIGTDYTPNKEIPEKLYSGINLIGKFAYVPDSTYIERNCRIMSRVEESEYKLNRVRSGENIHSKKEGGIFDMFLI